MAENKNILEVHHLKKSFITGKKSFTAVEDVSFSLKTGEVLGIVGESGSGKSTVAKMITHLTEPTAGEIFLMEKAITHARGKNLREIYREMQMIFQTPAESFDPRCTLGDGIGESLRNMGISIGQTHYIWYYISKDEQYGKIEKILQLDNINNYTISKSVSLIIDNPNFNEKYLETQHTSKETMTENEANYYVINTLGKEQYKKYFIGVFLIK